MKVLRSKVEQVERDKRELQMRISQSSQGGMAAFQAQELQRQLDVARQTLAHKEQEVSSRQTLQPLQPSSGGCLTNVPISYLNQAWPVVMEWTQ